MKLITTVFDQHNRGLFAVLILAAFAAAMILAGSFAAVDAEDGAGDTCAVDSYDQGTESFNRDFRHVILKYESNDPAKGTVMTKEQLVPNLSKAPPTIVIMTGVKDNFGLAITIQITFAIIPLPTWIGFNVAIPADGYVLDHWTVNGKTGSSKVAWDSTIVAHFKEKTVFP